MPRRSKCSAEESVGDLRRRSALRRLVRTASARAFARSHSIAPDEMSIVQDKRRCQGYMSGVECSSPFGRLNQTLAKGGVQRSKGHSWRRRG